MAKLQARIGHRSDVNNQQGYAPSRRPRWDGSPSESIKAILITPIARLSMAFSMCALIAAALIHDSLADVINVRQPPYAAAGDGASDDTDAINRAISTGNNIYIPATNSCYRTTSALKMSTPGQILYGDGRSRTRICPSTTPYAYGVFFFTSGEPGPELRDIGIVFDQPDAANRSELRKYEPAIYARNIPRFKLRNLRISSAWVGVDMTGNSGGALIDDLEISAFHLGVWIDGSLDSVRLDNVHSWPFELTVQQQEAFADPDAVSFLIGRCDDCKIRGGLSVAGTAMRFFAGSTGSAFGSVSDFAFDTNNGIDMSAGTINMSNVYFTLNPDVPVHAISMTGGTLNISTFWALAGPTSVPMVQVNSMASGTTILNMANGKIELGNQDSTFLKTIESGGQGHIGLTNTFIYANADIPHLNPVIFIDKGFCLQAVGNQISNKGTGIGTFMKVRHDDCHRIGYNASPGWLNSFPLGKRGVYGPN